MFHYLYNAECRISIRGTPYVELRCKYAFFTLIEPRQGVKEERGQRRVFNASVSSPLSPHLNETLPTSTFSAKKGMQVS